MPQLSELERTVTAWRAKGLAWVDAELKADLLERDKDSFLASIVNDLRKANPEASEKRLETDAKASPQYREFIKGMVLAMNEALRLKVEYQAVGKLFDARQSDQSLLREQLSKGVYHQGG